MSQWWEDFFDEDYVRAWTAAGAFEGSDATAAAIADLLAAAPGGEVLDVACGYGRIAGPLQQRGFRVTGIDASADQLRLAAQRNPGPTYLRRDMREPPPGPFDAVLNVFSSFGYFADRSDDRAALRAWQRVLRPGGLLLMELAHRDAVAHLYEGDDQVVETGGVRETGVTDWVSGVRTSTVTDGEMTKTFRVRLYTVTELVAELGAAGFRAVEARGGLGTSAPPTPLTRRLVLLATR
ncbi:MAG TPA: class I SAM-dependent methyltransferase [Egibacteraceae bacterium]